MNKDRIVGAAKQAKGAIKVATGKALGDAKLAAEGRSDEVEGKIQNVVGGLKDSLKALKK
ncbi:MAG: CsbD family protein [Reyranella sp.]